MTGDTTGGRPASTDSLPGSGGRPALVGAGWCRLRRSSRHLHSTRRPTASNSESVTQSQVATQRVVPGFEPIAEAVADTLETLPEIRPRTRRA
jgi:hypothetical protein